VGPHAGLGPVTVRYEAVPAALPHALCTLEERREREGAALEGLRAAPFGLWLDFLKERGLEAFNREYLKN